MRCFRAFPDDWLAGTAELTAEETGAYWNLICHFMAKDGVVPDDDVVLARVTKLSTRRWRTVKATLLDGQFIEIRDGMIWQRKAGERLKIDGNFAQTQREKAERKWSKKRAKLLSCRETPDAGADALADASLYPTKILDTSYPAAEPAIGTQENTPSPGQQLPSPPAVPAPIRQPSLTPDAVLWSKAPGGGLACLLDCGMVEPRARNVLGAWRKDYGDRDVAQAITWFVQSGKSDPVPAVNDWLKRRGARKVTARPCFDPNLI